MKEQEQATPPNENRWNHADRFLRDVANLLLWPLVGIDFGLFFVHSHVNCSLSVTFGGYQIFLSLAIIVLSFITKWHWVLYVDILFLLAVPFITH